MNADVGVWANFTCSVSCNHLINWFVGGYPSDISTECTSTLNDLMVCKETRHTCSSTPGATNNTETLKVLAKREHAGSNITVQCVAVSRIYNASSCHPFFTYSRFALLTGGLENIIVCVCICVCVYAHVYVCMCVCVCV